MSRKAVFGLRDDFGDRQPLFELFGVDELQLRAAARFASSALFEHRLEIGDLIDLRDHRTAELRANRVALFLQLIEPFEVHHLNGVRSGVARLQQQIAIALLEEQFRNAIDAARRDPSQLLFDLLGVSIANATIAQERFGNFRRVLRSAARRIPLRGLRPRARSAALLVTIPEATAKSMSTSNAFGCSGVGNRMPMPLPESSTREISACIRKCCSPCGVGTEKCRFSGSPARGSAPVASSDREPPVPTSSMPPWQKSRIVHNHDRPFWGCTSAPIDMGCRA